MEIILANQMNLFTLLRAYYTHLCKLDLKWNSKIKSIQCMNKLKTLICNSIYICKYLIEHCLEKCPFHFHFLFFLFLRFFFCITYLFVSDGDTRVSYIFTFFRPITLILIQNTTSHFPKCYNIAYNSNTSYAFLLLNNTKIYKYL